MKKLFLFLIDAFETDSFTANKKMSERALTIFLRNGQIDEALNEVTPDMATRGLTRDFVHNKDLISLFLCQVEDYEKAVSVIDTLVKKGYKKRNAIFPFEFHLPYLQHKSFLHLFLDVTGLYTNVECFTHMIGLVPRKELDPFFNAKTIVTLEDAINEDRVSGDFFLYGLP